MEQNTVTLRLDAVTTAQVPVYTLAQITDQRVGPTEVRPVIIGRSFWFTEEEARDEARRLSVTLPRPQRVVVYDPIFNYVVGFQCGAEMPVFVVED